MKTGICPYCEKPVKLEIINTQETITVRGEEVIVPVQYLKCSECGNDFEDPQSSHDPLAIAYQEYRRRHGFMQPGEIKDFRQRYGFTQRDLANLLGFGEVTLSRYENGALQNETHNTLLELIKEPHGLLNLIKQKGDLLPTEKKQKLITLLEGEIEESFSFPFIIADFFGKHRPDILSGFQRFNMSKFFQAIIFFCSGGVFKTKLNKLLFYADFKHYKDHAVSITGVRYVHLPLGPVPDKYDYYYATLSNEQYIDIEEVFFNDYVGEKLISKTDIDLSVFTNSEFNTLIFVKDFFRNFNASNIKEFSHKEKGYKETNDSQFIPYSFANDLQI